MPFHVPFNQRASHRQTMGPIYIGFEPPAPPRRKFNWWGFNGMWMSAASLLTAGFLSPLTLLISLNGLRKPGKKMAFVGTVISLAGITLATSLVASGVAHHRHVVHRREQAKQERIIKKQVAETGKVLAVAQERLVEYRGAHDGQLPEDIEGNMLMVSFVDAWGESLRFEPAADHALIRSAGPDRRFLTPDDLTGEVSGQTEYAQQNIPVEPLDY